MKFTCQKMDLLLGINTAGKAISNRSTLPILTCFLLKIETDTLYIIGNDLEIGIKSKVNAAVDTSGKVAIDSKLFSEIIRKLPEGEINISVDENNYVTITSGKSEYKIAGLSANDYPELPDVEKENSVIMFQDELRSLIRSTIFSIATEETKPVLMGELFEIEDNEVSLVAVDGFRISSMKGKLDNSNKNVSMIIPGKSMNELSKILSQDKEDKVTIYFTDKHVLFEIDGSIIVSRLIEGKYINYKQNLIAGADITMLVNRDSLLSAVERVSLITGLDKNIPIRFDIKGELLTLTTTTSIGMGHEEVACTAKGGELVIAFNPKYLLDALKVIDDEEIEMTFSTSLSPCIINPKEGDTYKYLILPVRLND